MRRHLDILDELEYITEHQGFVETCLELRDSMLFYDRSLVIASCAGTIELLVALGMFWACLESDREAEKTFEAIDEVFDNLPHRLMDSYAPIDVQALIDAFLQTGGWVLKNRLVLLKAMFRCYMYNQYDNGANVDQILSQANDALAQDNEKEAVFLYAQAGALALRGAHLRPAWLAIAPSTGQVWMKGILNVVNNFRAAPNFSFPLDAVEAERRKWRGTSSGVVDLKAFRNYRYPASSLTSAQSDSRDKIDELLERMFTEGVESDIAPEGLHELKEALEPIILSILKLVQERGNEPPWGHALVHSIRLVAQLQLTSGIEPLISQIEQSQPEKLIFGESLAALRALGSVAVNKVIAYVRTTTNLHAASALAEILGHAAPDEQAFNALMELFHRVDWQTHRDLVALALADYGDPRAIPLLKKALSEAQAASSDQKSEIRWALRELCRKNRRKTGHVVRSAALPGEEVGNTNC